ncbi:MAG: L,D-transpeptidase [Synechococcales bacterium]|nr:L,D-transpeptidase [Synechococcales bacterium]
MVSLAMMLAVGRVLPTSAQVPVIEPEAPTQAVRTPHGQTSDPTPSVASPVIRALRLQQPVYPTAAVLDPPFPMPVFPEVTPTLRLVIRLGERRVYVYRDDVVETSFPVAIGKPGWETPVGQHEILNMVENPEWRNPFTGQVIGVGPQNPLGDRWIGFWTDGNNYIGFHGTPNEGSVGRAASHGCVRMFNNDVRALFEIVAVGTPVIVEP